MIQLRWLRLWGGLAALALSRCVLAASPTTEGPATGLPDSAALRATVFGTPPQNIAPMPEKVPVEEMDISMPWARPVPPVLRCRPYDGN